MSKKTDKILDRLKTISVNLRLELRSMRGNVLNFVDEIELDDEMEWRRRQIKFIGKQLLAFDCI